jgi:hypothetical protein
MRSWRPMSSAWMPCRTPRADELAQLEAARAQRDAALVAIKADSRTSAQVLQRLQGQQSGI